MTYEDIIKSLQEQIGNLSLSVAVSEAQNKQLEQENMDLRQELENLKEVAGIEEK